MLPISVAMLCWRYPCPFFTNKLPQVTKVVAWCESRTHCPTQLVPQIFNRTYVQETGWPSTSTLILLEMISDDTSGMWPGIVMMVHRVWGPSAAGRGWQPFPRLCCQFAVLSFWYDHSWHDILAFSVSLHLVINLVIVDLSKQHHDMRSLTEPCQWLRLCPDYSIEPSPG